MGMVVGGGAVVANLCHISAQQALDVDLLVLPGNLRDPAGAHKTRALGFCILCGHSSLSGGWKRQFLWKLQTLRHDASVKRGRAACRRATFY